MLRRLQGEYESWRDGLPESLADSRTAELLEGVCDVDLDVLDVELPRGGRARRRAAAGVRTRLKRPAHNATRKGDTGGR